MNLFRLCGDLSHVVSIVLLLLKIRATRSCVGISLKTQFLYLVVFVTRYLDLFVTFISLYNSVMKVAFISTTAYILYLMFFKFKHTYDKDHDTFRIQFLIAFAAALAFVTPHRYSLLEVLWTFSLWLESVAILPQLYMLQTTGECENLTSHYIFALGLYRALYAVNWVYRYSTEPGYWQPVTWIAGILQTALYGDFFYYYVASRRRGKRLKLPT
ncbi:probable ER lumen protein retaining receptor [Cyanidioschyzon merolae strain 10D]|uniref:ER lumen protein-retaining receptor n=1 Tax=Cyanidioschyzon merolae (strain NIES-3377 / 10D) TaxID=280699 RepID=M1UW98_CYAM1|nr:probable ER lumen protein retaining receptor [Cyanidioschyzon merolae strain 10D]BAM82431.1 probable ER lumen protein retaining receptor [Cyanidioschyzon merolae strain 10D]|eukprot:XP_005538467.1 probable ER lumen protein retaining receptor [Cyanidioschyzon merolae strain 10D]